MRARETTRSFRHVESRSALTGTRIGIDSSLERVQGHQAADEIDALAIGCEPSFNFVTDTLWPDSIHFGAASRSSSGRFMAKAATSRSPRTHHALKLLLDR